MAQGKVIHYLCQDETRGGLKTESGQVMTAKGVKPKVAVQWGREHFWIYGAIAPLSGEHFWHEYPQLKGECFQAFLDGLSQQLGLSITQKYVEVLQGLDLGNRVWDSSGTMLNDLEQKSDARLGTLRD